MSCVIILKLDIGLVLFIFHFHAPYFKEVGGVYCILAS